MATMQGRSIPIILDVSDDYADCDRRYMDSNSSNTEFCHRNCRRNDRLQLSRIIVVRHSANSGTMNLPDPNHPHSFSNRIVLLNLTHPRDTSPLPQIAGYKITAISAGFCRVGLQTLLNLKHLVVRFSDNRGLRELLRTKCEDLRRRGGIKANIDIRVVVGRDLPGNAYETSGSPKSFVARHDISSTSMCRESQAWKKGNSRWRFHQSANSYKLERDPRGTDARSSPTFSHCRREGEEDQRRGWRKPVSPGGRFGVSGREDFLGNGEREDSRKTSYERQRQKDASRVEKG
ncbi:hypothetical protein DBV15_00013 [Temnothorax longispinosus]|uniref:Uncharacterized protein n=1 Tax=Temnothorax longispinosus TaxID=300112 RepID=A0A4S2KI70_9HYME|nr:hypothetical protein DBV15_00013 [Temnothorax longispinosus]